MGKPDRAEPLFRALCIADGRVADYWVGLGVCLRMRKDRESASLAFSVASSLRPDWAVPVFHACELALASGDISSAGRHMKRLDALLAAGARRKRPCRSRMLAEAKRMAKALQLRAGPGGRNHEPRLRSAELLISEQVEVIREIARNLLGEAPPAAAQPPFPVSGPADAGRTAFPRDGSAFLDEAMAGRRGDASPGASPCSAYVGPSSRRRTLGRRAWRRSGRSSSCFRTAAMAPAGQPAA